MAGRGGKRGSAHTVQQSPLGAQACSGAWPLMWAMAQNCAGPHRHAMPSDDVMIQKCHISRRLGIAGMCSCAKQAAADLGDQHCLPSCRAASQDAGGSMEQLLEMQLVWQILTAGCPTDACVLLPALQVRLPQMYQAALAVGWGLEPATLCFRCKISQWLMAGPHGTPSRPLDTCKAPCSVLVGDIMDNIWCLA